MLVRANPDSSAIGRAAIASAPANEQSWWDEMRSLIPERISRIDECGAMELLIRCGCAPRWVPRRCGQRWLCPLCLRSYYGSLYHRLIHGMTQQPNPGHFLTFSSRHTGDLSVDRAVIVRAWGRWRASAFKHWGETFPFVGVFEVTPSDSGHTHVHIYYHLSQRRPSYRLMRQWWVAGTDGASQWSHFVRAYGPANARAAYLANYLRKGIRLTKFEPSRAVSLLAAWHGKRVLLASHGYFAGYKPLCPKCTLAYTLATHSNTSFAELAGALRAGDPDSVPAYLPATLHPPERD